MYLQWNPRDREVLSSWAYNESFDGLNESFSQTRGQILLMDPLPSINRVFSLLAQEEKQNQFLMIHSKLLPFLPRPINLVNLLITTEMEIEKIHFVLIANFMDIPLTNVTNYIVTHMDINLNQRQLFMLLLLWMKMSIGKVILMILLATCSEDSFNDDFNKFYMLFLLIWFLLIQVTILQHVNVIIFLLSMAQSPPYGF